MRCSCFWLQCFRMRITWQWPNFEIPPLPKGKRLRILSRTLICVFPRKADDTTHAARLRPYQAWEGKRAGEGSRAYHFYRSCNETPFGSIRKSEKIKNWNFPNFTHPPSRVHMAHTHMSAERKFSCTAFSFMSTLIVLFSFHWEILSNISIDLKITAKATQISLTCFTLLTFLSCARELRR